MTLALSFGILPGDGPLCPHCHLPHVGVALGCACGQARRRGSGAARRA